MTTRTKRLLWLMSQKPKLRTFSGVPPLTFKAKKSGTLKNYRIYGNTVNGESVGDLVTEGEHAGEYRVPVTVEGKNLFGTEVEQGNILTDGTLVDSTIRLRTKNYLPCEKGDYVLSFSADGFKFGCRYYNANYNIIGTTSWMVKNNTFTVDLSDAKYMKLNFAKNDTTSDISPSDITNIQLEKRTIATDYEPYHTPVTTNLYLPEQIKMVGDEAEYVDYKEQKQHFADGTSIDVTLPAIPTLPGTNTLSVGTAVQPSNIEITGKIKGVTA